MSNFRKINFPEVAKKIFKKYGEIYSPSLCNRVWNRKQVNKKLLNMMREVHSEKYLTIDYRALSAKVSKNLKKIYAPAQIKQIHLGKCNSKNVLAEIKKVLKNG